MTDNGLNLNHGAISSADGAMQGKEDSSIDAEKLNVFNFEDDFTEKCIEFFSNLAVEAE